MTILMSLRRSFAASLLKHMVSRSKEQGGSDHARCSCRSKGVGCDWFVGDAARRRRLEVKAVRASAGRVNEDLQEMASAGRFRRALSIA